MEVEFLSNMRYSLYASEEEWKAWHKQLEKFAAYIDRASQTVQESTSRSVPPAASFMHKPANLPSPPASDHTSSAFPRSVHTGSGLLQPTTVAPFLPQTIASPASLPPPESEVRQWIRKRSLEDSVVEPPPKRHSSYIPSPASLSTSVISNNSSPAPRLPLPNVVGSVQHNGIPNSSGPLPLPSTRAMSTVFAASNRWHQGGTLPSLQPPQYLPNPIHSNDGSPGSEFQNRPSPFAHHSGTSSPTAYAFPAPQTHSTPAGLSPSGMPFPRNSPYKPVRRVNTLLVPPASSSIHHAPQHLSYDQMHYQPLGKPVSERRTGVLPYLPFDTWSQSHHMHHYLPQPPLHQV